MKNDGGCGMIKRLIVFLVCAEVIDNIIQEETVEEMTEKEGGKG